MPESIALIDRLRAEGHAAVVSGAGPSVLVLRRGDRTTGRRSPHSLRRGGRVLALEVDAVGAEVLVGTPEVSSR